MALPVAHAALALGVTRTHDRAAGLVLALLSILPDFDFLLVWGFGLSTGPYHRTFSHSVFFYLCAAMIWHSVRPFRVRSISASLVFVALLSHTLLDLMCVADPTEHGVGLLWPFSAYRMGGPVLVPLYRLFAASPFSLEGFIRLTLLEIVLAFPLWFCGRSIREGAIRFHGWITRLEFKI